MPPSSAPGGNFSERAISLFPLLEPAAIMAAALCLDYLLGEPRRAHPLVGFGRLAGWLERFCLERARPVGHVGGVAALLVLVAPLGAAAYGVERALGSTWYPLAAVPLLYLALGGRSLDRHGASVEQALDAGDLARGRHGVAQLVSRETEHLDAAGITQATVESVLENGNDAVLAPLFWFALAGLPGVVVFRLVNTLDAMWGYRSRRYARFGWGAARCDDLLGWLPARLCAAAYALAGNSTAAWRCRRTQGSRWPSPNGGVVMAAGAGALGVCLGGAARYHGQVHIRPLLGCGTAPKNADIGRAMGLVQRAALLSWPLLSLAALWRLFL